MLVFTAFLEVCNNFIWVFLYFSLWLKNKNTIGQRGGSLSYKATLPSCSQRNPTFFSSSNLVHPKRLQENHVFFFFLTTKKNRKPIVLPWFSPRKIAVFSESAPQRRTSGRGREFPTDTRVINRQNQAQWTAPGGSLFGRSAKVFFFFAS